MLNPILAFSATRRMRSFRTMLIVIAYIAAMLLLALVVLNPFMDNRINLSTTSKSPTAYLLLIAVQFGLLILIAPAMTSGAIAGERERQTLELLLVTNTGSFRILLGKVLESFAVLALLIVCGLPVMSLCLLTGGVTVGQILIGELFLLAEAFACVSVGVFCSALFRTTVVSAVMSYLMIMAIGAETALPFVFGYPQRITDVLYDNSQYMALTAGGALKMIPPLMYLNPGFGLLCLVQGETHAFSEMGSRLGWGRMYATWLMADRAGWISVAMLCAGAMLVVSLALIGTASLLIRRGSKKKS
jgi:ABC-type transport system involved in multi-copper enzyme maturation permease subunit